MRVRGRASAAGLGSVAVRLVLLGLVLLAVGGCSPAADGTASAAPAGGTPAASAARPVIDPLSGLPTVAAADLPVEARAVLTAIGTGGPFAYSQDGVVFSNREGILPKQTTGYYHEYTVPTPDSPDRGARRLVAGKAADVYYTADHYASFRRVWP